MFFCSGGYDERVSENVEHLKELKARATEQGLEELVEFRTNVGDGEPGVGGGGGLIIMHGGRGV